MKVKWVEHRSARAICKAYFHIDPLDVSEIDGFLSGGDFLKAIIAEGKWAFVETKPKIPVVHYWQDGKRSRDEMAFMLGHELGHVSGKQNKRSPIGEEIRADEYGDVVMTVLRRLVKGVKS